MGKYTGLNQKDSPPQSFPNQFGGVKECCKKEQKEHRQGDHFACSTCGAKNRWERVKLGLNLGSHWVVRD